MGSPLLLLLHGMPLRPIPEGSIYPLLPQSNLTMTLPLAPWEPKYQITPQLTTLTLVTQIVSIFRLPNRNSIRTWLNLHNSQYHTKQMFFEQGDQNCHLLSLLIQHYSPITTIPVITSLFGILSPQGRISLKPFATTTNPSTIHHLHFRSSGTGMDWRWFWARSSVWNASTFLLPLPMYFFFQ